VNKVKILAVSDNHGSRKELEDILTRHENEIDYWIHCGDSEFEDHDLYLEVFNKVRGNMDYLNSFPNELTLDFGGIPVYITHGHLFNVKMSFLNLYYRAEELGAKISFFGHSHTAGHFQKNGVVFINPGSISLPRGRKEKTYVICELKNSRTEIHITYYNENGEQLTDLIASYKL
jgi:uncharacterized protein